MASPRRHLRAIAEHFDRQGKPAATIRTDVTRATLMQSWGARPEKRGGPLYVGRHRVLARGEREPL